MKGEIQERIDEFKARRVEPTLSDLICEKKQNVDHDFFQIGEEKRSIYLKNGQQGTYLKWGYVMDKLKKEYPTLLIKDINRELLVSYKEHLVKLGNNQNTIHSNFKVLRAIYQEAIKKGITTVNPFIDLEIKQVVPTKERLDMAEITLIQQLSLQKGTNIYLAQKTFLFAFFCWGMRFRDVALLEWSNIEGNILSYTTSKSGFKKRISMILDPRAIEILNCFPKDGKYVFPLLRREWKDKLEFEKVVSVADATINENLKEVARQAEVKKKISFHTARHSFIDILKKKGVSTEKRMQMVGHTSESVHRMYHGDFDVSEISHISHDLLS